MQHIIEGHAYRQKLPLRLSSERPIFRGDRTVHYRCSQGLKRARCARHFSMTIWRRLNYYGASHSARQAFQRAPRVPMFHENSEMILLDFFADALILFLRWSPGRIIRFSAEVSRPVCAQQFATRVTVIIEHASRHFFFERQMTRHRHTASAFQVLARLRSTGRLYYMNNSHWRAAFRATRHHAPCFAFNSPGRRP